MKCLFFVYFLLNMIKLEKELDLRLLKREKEIAGTSSNTDLFIAYIWK